jgi:hypothetical protein
VLLLKDGDGGQVAVLFVKVEAIAQHKFVWDVKTHIV